LTFGLGDGGAARRYPLGALSRSFVFLSFVVIAGGKFRLFFLLCSTLICYVEEVLFIKRNENLFEERFWKRKLRIPATLGAAFAQTSDSSLFLHRPANLVLIRCK
jgi:hypothetical protein